jgi:large subunit ribosomal protein L21
MYAIISDGGRQYKVREGQELDIDYRKESAPGTEIRFERVLAVSQEGDAGINIGAPTVGGAVVVAEVIGVTRGEKVYIQKLRRRKNQRRRTGHRQWYTQIRIGSISGA